MIFSRIFLVIMVILHTGNTLGAPKRKAYDKPAQLDVYRAWMQKSDLSEGQRLSLEFLNNTYNLAGRELDKNRLQGFCISADHFSGLVNTIAHIIENTHLTAEETKKNLKRYAHLAHSGNEENISSAINDSVSPAVELLDLYQAIDNHWARACEDARFNFLKNLFSQKTIKKIKLQAKHRIPIILKLLLVDSTSYTEEEIGKSALLEKSCSNTARSRAITYLFQYRLHRMTVDFLKISMSGIFDDETMKKLLDFDRWMQNHDHFSEDHQNILLEIFNKYNAAIRSVKYSSGHIKTSGISHNALNRIFFTFINKLYFLPNQTYKQYLDEVNQFLDAILENKIVTEYYLSLPITIMNFITRESQDQKNIEIEQEEKDGEEKRITLFCEKMRKIKDVLPDIHSQIEKIKEDNAYINNTDGSPFLPEDIFNFSYSLFFNKTDLVSETDKLWEALFSLSKENRNIALRAIYNDFSVIHRFNDTIIKLIPAYLTAFSDTILNRHSNFKYKISFLSYRLYVYLYSTSYLNRSELEGTFFPVDIENLQKSIVFSNYIGHFLTKIGFDIFSETHFINDPAAIDAIVLEKFRKNTSKKSELLQRLVPFYKFLADIIENKPKEQYKMILKAIWTSIDQHNSIEARINNLIEYLKNIDKNLAAKGLDVHTLDASVSIAVEKMNTSIPITEEEIDQYLLKFHDFLAQSIQKKSLSLIGYDWKKYVDERKRIGEKQTDIVEYVFFNILYHDGYVEVNDGEKLRKELSGWAGFLATKDLGELHRKILAQIIKYAESHEQKDFILDSLLTNLSMCCIYVKFPDRSELQLLCPPGMRGRIVSTLQGYLDGVVIDEFNKEKKLSVNDELSLFFSQIEKDNIKFDREKINQKKEEALKKLREQGLSEADQEEFNNGIETYLKYLGDESDEEDEEIVHQEKRFRGPDNKNP